MLRERIKDENYVLHAAFSLDLCVTTTKYIPELAPVYRSFFEMKIRFIILVYINITTDTYRRQISSTFW